VGDALIAKGRAWTGSLAAFLFFLLLTSLLTYPLVRHLGDAVEDGQDALLNVWIMTWDSHALLTDPLHLFDANIFYPYANTLAYSEINLSQALLALPVTLVSGNPVLGYNAALFLTFVLSGWGMYLLVRRLTGSGAGGLAAGIVFAFDAFKLSNLAQIQLVSLHWLPFALLCLDHMLTTARQPAFDADSESGHAQERLPAGANPPTSASRSSRLWPCLLALFLILQALASFYYALFTVLAVGLFLLCALSARRQAFGRAIVGRLVVTGLVAALVVLPFAWPYFSVRSELGFQRSLSESEPFSASLSLYSQALPGNLLYGRALAPLQPVVVGGYPLDALFPGFLTLALTAGGLWVAARAWRRHLFYLLLVPLAFVLSLGPTLYLDPRTRLDLPFYLPYAWLYALVPGFQALRAPERFAALVYLGLAVLVGLAVARLARGGRRAALVSVAAAGFLALECLTLPAAKVFPVATGDAVPAVYRWLAAQPPTIIVELPLGGRDASVTLLDQYYSIYHWQRTPDGYSGFIPPKHGEMAYELASFPSTRSLALLRGYGVQYLVVHGDRLTAPLPALPNDLALVETFGADQVYRLLAQPAAAAIAVSAYLPPVFVPGASYTAYLIVRSLGPTPLVVLPTYRPSVQAVWQASDGSARRDSVPAAIPIVTSEASMVPVSFPAMGSQPQTVTVQMVDPLLGRVLATAALSPAAGSAGQPFPVPVSLVTATVSPSSGIPDGSYAPGQTVSLDLRWRALGKIDAYYSAFAALVDKDGHPVSRVDGEPQQGRRPTLLWAPDEEIPDHYSLALPASAMPGRYTVEVGLYRAADLAPAMLLDAQGSPVSKVVVGSIKVPAPVVTAKPQHPIKAVLGGKILLLGYDITTGDRQASGTPVTITLYWQARQPLGNDYTVFAHLLGEDGRILAQEDGQPMRGQYPTSLWSVGEVVADSHSLIAPAGLYRLALGMYDLATMTRLPVGGGDEVMLEGVRVP
jgi:hypothetical protein